MSRVRVLLTTTLLVESWIYPILKIQKMTHPRRKMAMCWRSSAFCWRRARNRLNIWQVPFHFALSSFIDLSVIIWWLHVSFQACWLWVQPRHSESFSWKCIVMLNYELSLFQPTIYDGFWWNLQVLHMTANLVWYMQLRHYLGVETVVFGSSET